MIFVEKVISANIGKFISFKQKKKCSTVRVEIPLYAIHVEFSLS